MTNQPKPPGETPLELKRYIALRAHTVARWGRSMPHGAKRREDEMSEKPDAPMSDKERADRLEGMLDRCLDTIVDLKAENAALRDERIVLEKALRFATCRCEGAPYSDTSMHDDECPYTAILRKAAGGT